MTEKSGGVRRGGGNEAEVFCWPVFSSGDEDSPNDVEHGIRVRSVKAFKTGWQLEVSLRGFSHETRLRGEMDLNFRASHVQSEDLASSTTTTTYARDSHYRRAASARQASYKCVYRHLVFDNVNQGESTTQPLSDTAFDAFLDFAAYSACSKPRPELAPPSFHTSQHGHVLPGYRRFSSVIQGINPNPRSAESYMAVTHLSRDSEART
ncbi:uncharacterized protein LACBIDRAFT_331192 [Laccaria bicolor S238N-H82]|uniref:Predicted protein n=1 Tax=Laccaria bicolor (strain S238N-H82 / ATCC MYA-4686) TaxID=486041 RepID=B0DNR2_LACBS|nr:uncharacterized protein LACBIDRAFT_331192 [Laccaria bicolor S238N-H82]EDR03770.1 predicted protein [Laccaria bicolor S238N-H82]|eukprot:XP_001885623.1 predicted protein [Laccaria bicolor S238N-H82]